MENDNNSKPNCQDSVRMGIIYLITNLINGKKYVGQTRQKLRDRMYQHRSSKKTSGIDGAIQKYGWEKFTVEVIEECPVENLNEREKYWIEFYDCKAPKGYNLTDGGDGILNCSQSTRAKLSKASKGRPLSQSARENLAIINSGEGNPFYGKHHTEKTKATISEKLTGRKLPKSTCDKMAESRTGEKNPFYGKSHTQATRDKISASLKARNERIRAEKAAKALENIGE